MLSRNASWPVEFVLKNITPVELLGSSGLTPFRSTKTAVAFSCSVPLLLSPSVTRRLCPSTKVIPFGWRLSVRFPVSIAFIVAVAVVAFGGIIVLLPAYDTSVYVSLIGLKLVNLSSPVKNRLPKRGFETLLVVVVVLLTPVSNGSIPPFHSHSAKRLMPSSGEYST